MRMKKKDPKEHGIISIVQSPNKDENHTVDKNKLVTENEPDHGIISIVQSPDEVKNKKNV
ncbi:hypothetical protein [Emticicia sp. SJ17W-69]|uniref:hypothetical protein n=1 Tax=Emticicia sp. SJ17W-69 TaxID=3421657 RepID=UPI003EBCEF52